jgi:hypothetical protein
VPLDFPLAALKSPKIFTPSLAGKDTGWADAIFDASKSKRAPVIAKTDFCRERMSFLIVS